MKTRLLNNFTLKFNFTTVVICVLMILSITQAYATTVKINGIDLQQRTLSGTVTDENGLGLPGVNILEKGTSNGTISDASGQYKLAATGTNPIIVFSFTGYVSEEIQSTDSDILSIGLTPDIASLSEIVVVGYGTQKRADLTGSIGSVKGKDINNLPVRSVAEALQGRVAGVEVVKDDGAPGSESKITIRGVSSLNNPDPIYIIDGVRSSSGASFNVQDIETLDVLKDASAASIYGASAAGGVIIITTKKGKSGKMNVNFNAYTGISKPILNTLLDRDDFVIANAAIQRNVTNGKPLSELPNTNWGDELYRNGVENNYNLSISGGNDKSSYYLSAGYINEKGTYIDTDFERYSFRINSNHKLTDRLKVGEFLLINKTFNNNAVQDGGLPFRSIPTMAVYDETNPVGGFGKAPSGFGGANIVGLERSIDPTEEDFGIEGNVFGELEIIDGLVLKSTFGYNFGSSIATKYQGAYDFGPVSNFFPSLEKSISNNEFFTANTTLTYTRSIRKHNVQATAGFERLQAIESNLQGSSKFLALNPTKSFFTTTDSTDRVSGVYNDNNLIKSFFGRVNYDFNGKYLLTASIRKDADYQKFGPTNQAGIFPAFSLGWKISEEGFIKNNLPLFDLIKIRASYGELGNNQIGGYQFLSRYTSDGQGENSFGGGKRSVGYGLLGLANPSIQWESLNISNYAIDFSLFKSKLNVTLEYYVKNTDGMIYNIPIALSSGLGETFTANVGKVSNKGFEWAVFYSDQVGEINFSAGVTGALNRNKVVSLDGVGNNPINDGGNGTIMPGQTTSRTVVGRSFGEFYGYVADGIFATDDEAAEHAQFVGDNISRAGDIKFRDVPVGNTGKGDGILDEKDMQFIGNPNPKMSYGINFTASWKGFDASILFNGLAGVDIFNGVASYKSYLLSDGNTTSDIFKTSYFNGNGLTDRPAVGHIDQNSGAYVTDPNENYTRVSSYWIEKGNYLKLKNIQVGYSLPSKWTNSIHISRLRLYVMANNVFSLTNYSGLDPEIGGDVTNRGIDYTEQYPRNRLYTMGIDINF